MKRLLDIVLVLMVMPIWAFLMVLLMVLVYFKLGSPVFFRQSRAGFQAKPLTLFKFRTMTDARDAEGNLLPDAERLTDFGRLLRSTSLDELPELVSVLKGDMSLVGPRPLLMQYLPRYSVEQARRHGAKPGMTGWAQINGRNEITWEEKFALDVWYVDHRSLGLDLKIIGLTIWKLLRREGINEPGEATAREFLGSSKDNL